MGQTMKIVAKITTNNGIVGYLGIVGIEMFSLFDTPRIATRFSERKEAEEAVKGYWQEQQTSGTVEYLLVDEDGEILPQDPIAPPPSEPTLSTKKTEGKENMKIVVKISNPKGLTGFITKAGAGLHTKYELVAKACHAYRFEDQEQAIEAVTEYWLGRNLLGQWKAEFMTESPVDSEEAQEPTSPRIPPNKAIMAMFRNRIKDAEIGLEILGRQIKENNFADISTTYATVAMSFAAIADYADFFDSVINELHVCKSSPRLVIDPRMTPQNIFFKTPAEEYKYKKENQSDNRKAEEKK